MEYSLEVLKQWLEAERDGIPEDASDFYQGQFAMIEAVLAKIQELGAEEQLNKPKAINGMEQDAIYAKKWFHWRPGERKAVKQIMNRRFRRQARQELDSE